MSTLQEKSKSELIEEIESLKRNVRDLEKNKLKFKQAEEALKENNENFQQVVSNITTVVWKADIGNNGAFENTYTSPVVDELLELPAGTLQNDWDKYFRYIKPEYLERVNNAFREAIKSPGKLIDCEYEVLKDNKQTAWFHSKGRCFEKNGKLYVFGSTIDITERKNAEKELRNNEEKYRLLADNSIDAIWQMDLKLFFTYISPSVKNVMGYSVEECIGTRLSQHTSTKEFFNIARKALYAIKNYKKFKYLAFEAVMLRKDGSEIAVEITAKLLLNKKGLPVGLQGTTRDTTGRKKVEEKEKEHIKNISLLSETAMQFVEFPPDRDMYDFICEKVKQLVGEGIVCVNSIDLERDTLHVRKVLGIGKAMLKMINKLLGTKIVDMPFSDILQEAKDSLISGKLAKVEGGLHAILFHHFHQALCQQIEKLIGIKGLYSIGLRRKGILLGSVTIMALKNSRINKSVIETFVNQASVALERKRAEEALRESESLLRQVINTSPNCIYVKDREGRYVLVNQRMADMHKTTPEALIGLTDLFLAKKWLISDAEIEEFRAAELEVIDKKQMRFIPEEEFTFRDGTKRWFQTTKSPIILNNKQDYLMSVAVDITERKQIEEALQESKERFSLFMDYLPAVVFIKDEKSRTLYVNKHMNEVLGAKDWIGKSIFDLYPKDIADVMLADDKNALAEGYHMSVETVSDKHRINHIYQTHKFRIERYGKPPLLGGIAMDITERKLTEDTLKQSEKSYRDLFNNATDAIYIQDREGRFLDVNQGAVNMYGYPKEFFLGKTPEFLSAKGKNDMKKIMGIVEDAFNGKPQQYEFWGIRKNGEVFPKIVRSQKGLFQGQDVIITFALDITERIRAENDLKQSETKFRLLSDYNLDLEYWMNPEGKYIYISPACERITGYKPEEIMFEPDLLINITRPDYRDRIKKHYHDENDENLPTHTVEFPIIHRNGEERWIEHTCRPVFDDDGNYLGRRGNNHDITNRKKVEIENKKLFIDNIERIKELNCLYGLSSSIQRKEKYVDFFYDLLDLIPEAWHHTDFIKAKITFDGKEYSKENFKENKWKQSVDLVIDDNKRGTIDVFCMKEFPELDEGLFVKEERDLLESIAEILSEAIKSKESERELRYHREHLEKMIQERTAELNSKNKGLIESQQAMSFLIEDVNETRDKLRSLVNQLENSNRELESFSYSVSHDLKAPLRAIDGFSKILLEDYSSSLDKQGQHYLKRARAATQKMGQLIDVLLNLSRVGRKQLNIKEINIESIANEVYKSLEDERKERKINFIINKCPQINADYNLMQIALTNMLSNAIKFTKNKETAKIEIGSKTENKQTVFFIKDNGAGFDMKYEDELFSPFKRLHDADEYEGTGIGLAIVKRIINRHRGSIWVKSEINKGTTFYFTLPE
ncbi:MAG: PAS domain S-box protein [Bacteroidales bacterium]|nr:PAS domain S-box protein [Bacteroidales bacterium]